MTRGSSGHSFQSQEQHSRQRNSTQEPRAGTHREVGEASGARYSCLGRPGQEDVKSYDTPAAALGLPSGRTPATQLLQGGTA